MANNDQRSSAPAPAAAPASNVEQQLAAAMSALAQSQAQIATLMERQADFNEKNAVRRRRTMEDYLKKNPRKRFKHQVFQNGHEVSPAGLSQDTIDAIDGIDTGTYADGVLQVVRIKDGPEGINSRIHLFYNNKSLEQRMSFYMRFRTFTEIVNAIVTEMRARGKAPVVEDSALPPPQEFPESL